MLDTEILDHLPSDKGRRRELLPLWIKIFLWIFMVFGFLAPICLLLGFFDITFNVAFYGLETTSPHSLTGILIISLFSIKGVVSFGLWTEKSWAVNVAIVDAIIGIYICIITMFVFPFLSETKGFFVELRLELVALIPYWIKMRRIKEEWKQRG